MKAHHTPIETLLRPVNTITGCRQRHVQLSLLAMCYAVPSTARSPTSPIVVVGRFTELWRHMCCANERQVGIFLFTVIYNTLVRISKEAFDHLALFF